VQTRLMTSIGLSISGNMIPSSFRSRIVEVFVPG
jgi:hypothetical protein